MNKILHPTKNLYMALIPVILKMVMIKISRVEIVPQNLLRNLNRKQMSLQNNGLEIIKVTKVKNRDINLKKDTNYLTVIRKLEYNAVANVCSE